MHVICNVSRNGKLNLMDTTTSSCLSVLHNINVLIFISDSCSVIFPFQLSFLDYIERYIHSLHRSLQYRLWDNHTVYPSAVRGSYFFSCRCRTYI